VRYTQLFMLCKLKSENRVVKNMGMLRIWMMQINVERHEWCLAINVQPSVFYIHLNIFSISFVFCFPLSLMRIRISHLTLTSPEKKKIKNHGHHSRSCVDLALVPHCITLLFFPCVLVIASPLAPVMSSTRTSVHNIYTVCFF